MKEKGYYRKFLLIGPGGKRCPCCFPAPGKERKAELKITQKRELRFLTKLIDKELY